MSEIYPDGETNASAPKETTSDVTEEEVAMYLDGELPESRHAVVDRALATNEKLARFQFFYNKSRQPLKDIFDDEKKC